MPEWIRFPTRPEIALGEIGKAQESWLPDAGVLAGVGFGAATRFREPVAEMDFSYVVGVQGSVSLWRLGEAPAPPKAQVCIGRRKKLLLRSGDHRPAPARESWIEMGQAALQRIAWREGSSRRLQSLLMAVRIRPAHRESGRA